MKYRPEVDGLRSIAVVPVILFHAEVALFSGGYVGVDVFFVISGYLITGILAAEMAEDRFSLVRFYERRARRILPALFAVMLACLPFAWMWMLPQEMLNFSRSLVAVGVFASNVLFFLQAGYFGPATDELPLIHTWSLAVEEQFYIVFPILLLAIWRLGRSGVMVFLTIVAVASLLLCHLLVTPQPDATFYLIHTRAWELLAGSLVALWQLRSGTRLQNRSEIGALIGLAMILYSVFAFDYETPFPSLWAIFPVLGSALILFFAAPGTIVARMLSVGPMVGIGLISYSAYLIHQPLLAFARIRSLTEPDHVVLLALAALTFPLAWLSWRYIEQPFRKSNGFSRKSIFVGSGIGLSCVVALGLVGHVNRGLPDRMPADALEIARAGSFQNPRKNVCTGSGPVYLVECMTEGAGPRVALIGDSHSDALAAVLHDALADAQFTVFERNELGCWPLPGFFRATGDRTRCERHAVAVLDHVGNADFDAVVITARWTNGLIGEQFDNGEGGVEPAADWSGVRDTLALPDGVTERGDNRARIARVTDALKVELEKLLMEQRVVLVYPIPEAGWNVTQVASKAALFGQTDQDFSTSYDLYQRRNQLIMETFDAIDHPNLTRFRPDQILCDTFVAGRCATMLDGLPLYRDDDHLSRLGSELVSEPLVGVIAEAATKPDA